MIPAGDSVAVAEHDGNVMAFYTGSNYKPAYPTSPWFAPYVTGITPIGIDTGDDDDNDDGATIAANMCRALALFTYDGNTTEASCYCSYGDPICSNPIPFTVTTTPQPCSP